MHNASLFQYVMCLLRNMVQKYKKDGIFGIISLKNLSKSCIIQEKSIIFAPEIKKILG